MESVVKNLLSMVEFPEGGILSRVLVKSSHSQHTLFCLAKGTEISEHTSTREASVLVLQGTGLIVINDQEIALQAGTFIFMPAHTPHAVKAEEDVAFLLSLSG